MALLPTGSDKLLEIQSGNVYVVIKSKNPHPNLINKNILKQSSTFGIVGMNVNSVKILGEEKVANGNGAMSTSSYRMPTCPLFFEQTDYEIVIKSNDGKSVSLWHENQVIRNKISPVTDTDDLISGIINFGNSAGRSDFEVFYDRKKLLCFSIEVFPSKVSYQEDFYNMMQDISNEINGAVWDFMRNTYIELNLGATKNTIPALFYEIITRIFDKFQNAANTIISSPHHKLYVEHPVVPAHKVKKIDKQTIKWLTTHPQNVIPLVSGYSAIKAPTVTKQITYNTIENQFTKFILKSTVGKLKDFRERYVRSAKKQEQNILDCVDGMTTALSKCINTSFLREVDDYKPTQSVSLVFEMAPGYRELYKYYLMMQRGLSVHGDVFRLSPKDTAQLYEYWCFIKLVALLKKKEYKLISSDVIKVDQTGVTVSLVKGKRSEVKFVTLNGGTITLSYNPGEQNTQTVSQRPDNVLTLEKIDSNVPYKYVFDAKYRIENNPSDPFYPDNKPGPKVDDINTMHRYRDSIVYENDTPSRFMFEKTMFGAYVLFPYDDPDGEYRNHRFYKSIETVNIGGLPFLPGTTELVEEFLSELITDSSESAFERASLPRGIEDRLAKVDWSVKDVLVGPICEQSNLQFCIDQHGYYIPEKCISAELLPVKYIALSEEHSGGSAYINLYGEVLTIQRLRARQLPIRLWPDMDDEEYGYYFAVKCWEKLENPIAIENGSLPKPAVTNLFLLEHSKESYQLFAIASEEEYRLMAEINQAFDDLSAEEQPDKAVIYRLANQKAVLVSEGFLTVANDNGDILRKIPMRRFARSPRVEFNKIKKLIQ